MLRVKDVPIVLDQLERWQLTEQHALKALSTAFLDSYLREDSAAKTWLDGNGPRSILEKKDRWQTK